jgi:hypothetical protein
MKQAPGELSTGVKKFYSAGPWCEQALKIGVNHLKTFFCECRSVPPLIIPLALVNYDCNKGKLAPLPSLFLTIAVKYMTKNCNIYSKDNRKNNDCSLRL